MKVLMFGWEFPPYISGGLGTACYAIFGSLMMLPRRVLFSATLLALLGSWRANACSSCSFVPPGDLLPPHLSYPKPPVPGVPSEACVSCGDVVGTDLRFGEKGSLFHLIPLDTTGWADRLLTIEAGFPDPWSPETAYGIYPEGAQGLEGKLLAIVGRIPVLFAGKLSDIGAWPVASFSRPSYTLRRVDGSLVLEHEGDQRWVFTTEDEGKTWKLERMERRRLPGRVVKVDYRAGKISAVRFPGDLTAEFEYEGGFVSKVLLPSGEVVRIHRDSNGFLSEVAIFADARPRRQEPVSRYLYECDSEGRLVSYVDPRGERFKIEHACAAADGKDAYTTIVRRRDGSYCFHRHLSGDGKWVLEDGLGAKGQALKDATLFLRRELVKKNTVYKTVKVAENDLNSAFRYELDEDGNTVKATDPLGNITNFSHGKGGKLEKTEYTNVQHLQRHDGSGQLIHAESPDRKTDYAYDDLGRLVAIEGTKGDKVTYAYPDGDTVVTEKSGQKHSFKLDASGRVASYVAPGGVTHAFGYEKGRLTQEEIVGTQGEREVVRHLYDAEGRLTQSQYPGGKFREYRYRDGRLSEVKGLDGERLAYRYEREGLLKEVLSGGRSAESYSYYPSGRLKDRHVRGTKPDENVSEFYSPWGQLVRYTRGGEVFEADKSGALVKAQAASRNPVTYASAKSAAPPVVMVAYEGQVADTDLKRGVVIFGTQDCATCTWLKEEWLPVFLENRKATAAYFADLSRPEGYKLLARLERETGTSSMSFPAVYFKGVLVYGVSAIQKWEAQ